MLVPDEPLLDEFRSPGACELCGKAAPKREPHHCFTVGASGGNIDVRENIVGVSAQGTLVCHCHRLAQDGFIPKHCVLTVIAFRELRSVDEIERFIYAIRRAPKGTDIRTIREDVFGAGELQT